MGFREVTQAELQTRTLADINEASRLDSLIKKGTNKTSPFLKFTAGRVKIPLPKLEIPLPKQTPMTVVEPVAVPQPEPEATIEFEEPPVAERQYVPVEFTPPEPKVKPLEIFPEPEPIPEPVIPVAPQVLEKSEPIERKEYRRAFRTFSRPTYPSTPRAKPQPPTPDPIITPKMPEVKKAPAVAFREPSVLLNPIDFPRPTSAPEFLDTEAIYGKPLPMKGDLLASPEAKVKPSLSTLKLKNPSVKVGHAIISVFFAVRIVLGSLLAAVGMISMGTEYNTLRFTGDLGAMYMQYNFDILLVIAGTLIVYDALRHH